MLTYILIKYYYNFNNITNVSDLKLQLDYFQTKKVKHHALLETFWTLVPAIILSVIAIPSFQLLYSMELLTSSFYVVKVTGHQWYWSYEKVNFFESVNKTMHMEVDTFDSYLITEDNLDIGEIRLLTVDNNLEIPFNTHIKLIITSNDVIHSWGVANFGIKMDAVPGRLNQTGLLLKKPGIFYGHCYELCGINHANMPIVVTAYNPYRYRYKYLHR